MPAVIDAVVGECESCRQIRPLHIAIVGDEMFAVCPRCSLDEPAAGVASSSLSAIPATPVVVPADSKGPA